MWRRRIKAAWAFYRQVSAFKGLLAALGIWKWLGLGIFIVASWVVARFTALPPWGQLLAGLVVLAVLLPIGVFVLALVKIWKQPTAIDAGVASFPQLVFRLDKRYKETAFSAESDLILRNSAGPDALDIRLMPTIVGKSTIKSRNLLNVNSGNEGRLDYLISHEEDGREWSDLVYRHPLRLELDEAFQGGHKILTIPLTITYKNPLGQRFETTMALVHHPLLSDYPRIQDAQTRQF
jgi:hypothetical protein